MNIGIFDLAAGPEFIVDMQNLAEFPFISSNIVDTETGKQMFPSTAIVETHDQKLGFVGVTVGDKRLKKFEFLDPVETVKAAVAELKGQVDLIFLLANVDDKTEIILAETIEDIDFIIRSKTSSVQRNPKQHNGIVTIKIGKQGKYAAALKIRNVDSVNNMVNVSAQYKRIKFTENRLKAMSRDLKEGETLESHYATDQKRLELIAKLRADLIKNRETITTLKNSFYLEAIPLNDKIEDTPEVAVIVADYMPKVKKAKAGDKVAGKH